MALPDAEVPNRFLETEDRSQQGTRPGSWTAVAKERMDGIENLGTFVMPTGNNHGAGQNQACIPIETRLNGRR